MPAEQVDINAEYIREVAAGRNNIEPRYGLMYDYTFQLFTTAWDHA
ncbi:hypothetical protein AB0H88_24280 [Nonomuraea sp. NPDC050680]